MAGPQVHLLTLILQSQVHPQFVFLLVLMHIFLEAVTLGPCLEALTVWDFILSWFSILQQAGLRAHVRDVKIHVSNTQQYWYLGLDHCSGKALLWVSQSVTNWSVMSNSLPPHGLQPTRLPCPCNSPCKNTGVGCHYLLQKIFPTQRWNPGLPCCRQILYSLSHQEAQDCRVLGYFAASWPRPTVTIQMSPDITKCPSMAKSSPAESHCLRQVTFSEILHTGYCDDSY